MLLQQSVFFSERKGQLVRYKKKSRPAFRQTDQISTRFEDSSVAFGECCMPFLVACNTETASSAQSFACCSNAYY